MLANNRRAVESPSEKLPIASRKAPGALGATPSEKISGGDFANFVALREPIQAASEAIERGILADVEAMLREHSGRLEERYAVSALGLVGVAGADLRLLARFARTPDLFAFFELELLLGQLLGRRVDLMPAEAVNSDLEAAQVVWFEVRS